MTGIEFLLLMILHTPRGASHGHDIIINRFNNKEECISIGEKTKKDNRDHYICIGVAAITKEREWNL